MAEEAIKEEEVQLNRDEIAAQVWEDDGMLSSAPKEKPEKKEEVKEEPKEPDEKKEEPPDPWAGVPPAIKDSLDGISYRLKQTESRIGSIQNEMHAAKKATEDVKPKEAPSEKQIKESVESQEEWDALKDEFPAWAKAIDGRLAATSAMIGNKLPDTKGLETKIETLETTVDVKIDQAVQRGILSYVHKDWEKTIQDKDYLSWLSTQPSEIQVLTGSQRAADAIHVLDKFLEFRKTPKKTVAEIEAERKKRLEVAKETRTTHKEKPNKAEADMTDEELRAKIAKEVFSDN